VLCGSWNSPNRVDDAIGVIITIEVIEVTHGMIVSAVWSAASP
jgi:hypothetical protein